MELLQTDNYYILNKNEASLWFNRKTGTFDSKTCWDLAGAENPNCLGIVYAIIGKIQILPDFSPRLALVAGVKEVGSIREQFEKREYKKVYAITRVIFLPITSSLDYDLTLAPCHKHNIQHPNSLCHDRKNILPFGDFHQKVGFSKTFGTIKNVTSTIKTATVNAAANATGQNKSRKEARDKERFERRIFEELNKMFTESESFYFCYEADITNSLQRQSDPSYDFCKPLWQRADERFFWNKQMLIDFQSENNSIPDIWLVPIIQGFIQIEKIPLEQGEGNMTNHITEVHANEEQLDSFYTIALISRRSRERAGTRYKRRGVDDKGNVANYVETEQILTFSHHQVSFVQIRGSVPVYWSQPGYKYRPPPRLDRDPEETAVAFKKHFEKELEIYKRVTCISLGEQTGKEKVISDAFLNNIMQLDSPLVTFVAFDFHEYCRGMRYENVSVLLESIDKLITSMYFCWVDNQGIICQQNGVFRVNCIDCLDRTNVVQMALAKAALETQFAKLGILPPEYPLHQTCRSILQTMWANNGDAISKQYAGTSALKGDFTRTGERNFAGLMKDGMNSANRYYLNRFKDAYRQATIDAMLGNPISVELITLNPDAVAAEEDDGSIAQHVKHVIDDCKKLLVPDAETILGAWGLIDADPTTGDPEQTDMDIILVLTRDSYYIAQYEEEADVILDYQRISLIDLEKIELGPYTFQSVFKQARSYFCIRFNYQVDGQLGYHHTFRSMNIRFFNNMAVTIKTEEEILESVKAISDTFEVASQMMGCDVTISSCKLEKVKSRGRNPMANPFQLLSPIASFSKTSPDSIKSVGTRAFSNMTSGLAKLNPMTSIRARRVNNSAIANSNFQFYIHAPIISVVDSVIYEAKNDIYLTSCGILVSSYQPVDIKMPLNTLLPLTKSKSDSDLLKTAVDLQGFPAVSSSDPSPEIHISAEGAYIETPLIDMHYRNPNILSPSLRFSRLRKLSHSSDDLEVKEVFEEGSSGIQRASSASELDQQLTLEINALRNVPSPNVKSMAFSPLSPLTNFNTKAVLAPFSVLARGVQSLAPGAGKLARGVQNMGVNLDPRKLRAQHQKQLEENIELNTKILKCKSSIILL